MLAKVIYSRSVISQRAKKAIYYPSLSVDVALHMPLLLIEIHGIIHLSATFPIKLVLKVIISS